ncbi:DUF6412 domain-containing protein [Microbispora sp. NPDC046973]|uniref:DUF6412 domain-containing protein n=1 Tax=Microbispora sp. NPDC046973 TaxID=3155022 RepID=UPI003410C90D
MNALQATIGSLVWLLAVSAAGSSGPGALTAAGLAGAAVLVFAWMLCRLTGVPVLRQGPGRPSYTGETAMVRLRDPGTPGRPRPRAPSGSPALV